MVIDQIRFDKVEIRYSYPLLDKCDVWTSCYVSLRENGVVSIQSTGDVSVGHVPSQSIPIVMEGWHLIELSPWRLRFSANITKKHDGKDKIFYAVVDCYFNMFDKNLDEKISG